MRDSTFAVEGMFCGGCAATVERAMRRMAGVSEVNVSFLGNAACVRHDPAIVGVGEIRTGIARLGYATRALGEDAGGEARDAFERDLQVRLGVAVGFGMWVMLASVARLFTPIPNETLAWSIALFSGIVSLPVLLFSGGPFLRLGWLGLRERVPGMESLILLASVAAVGGSLVSLVRGDSDVWFDVPVMLVAFQLFARLADFGARRRAADAVRAMLDLSPERAWRVRKGGDGPGDRGPERIERVALAELVPGDIVECRAGERVPSDGVLVDGEATIDASLVSGEALPRPVRVGTRLIGGTLNLDGVVRVRVEAAYGSRRIDVLAASVGRLLNAKSDLMRLADSVAGALVPALLVASAVAAVLAFASGEPGADILERALAVLVVSCPCALSLAVPLVVSASAAVAARHGIVLRAAAALERASRLDTVVLDKTGTLTEGRPRVERVRACRGMTGDDVIALAALAGAGSAHPLMRAIRAASEGGAPSETGRRHAVWAVSARRERAGRGVVAVRADGSRVLAGSRRWLSAEGVDDADGRGDPELGPATATGSEVCVAVDDRLVGAIELEDTVRHDAPRLVEALRGRGLDVVLASGDREGAVRSVADRLGIAWHAAMSPEDKAALVMRLGEAGRTVAFVGDGLNDGPALAAAPLGIATGEASDLARSAAAMAVIDGGLERIEQALGLARRACRALHRNLFWALFYNALMLPAAVFGFVHPVMAVVAMGASSLSVSLNSLLVGRRPR